MSDTGKWLSKQQPLYKNQPKPKGVLLAQHSAETISDIFSVINNPVRLLAFGLTGSDVVDILSVWRPPSDMERDSCGKLISTTGELEKPHSINGHPVQLTSSRDEIVIDAKGHYRLEFRGENRPNIQVISLEDDIVEMNDSIRGIG